MRSYSRKTRHSRGAPKRRLLSSILTRITTGAICASMLVLVGCQQQQTSDRDTVQIAGKAITVLDNPELTSYDKSETNTLVRLVDVRGLDWLSEEQIIIDRENRDFKPEHIEGSDWYPHNLYVHTLSTAAQVPLLPANENQGFALASPDRTRIFYKTFSLQSNTGQGHFLDLATGKTASFTEADAMDNQNGRWMDNESVVFATIDGKAYVADVGNDRPRLVADTAIPFPNNVAFLNERVYFTSLKGTLLTSPQENTVVTAQFTNVIWMVPSPDEQRLAIVRKLSNGGEMELIITDLEGNVLQAIAQDSQIYGTAWSPDGKKLAYAGITPSGTVRGVYVADTSTGLSNTLSLDVKFIADPLRWNPSSNRLMVTSTQPDEQKNRNQFITYLVRIS
ncbi:TolB family protein [Cohnella herbarum]|uniref:TolB protein n=1 Tax=Cohnella herbarum TaxID=2728023 RepID=A0A7Z2VJH9_9BACL|nr:PD40 domain-containing protein [Cohnella herbarum]QJD84115.1 hypothetical protein HH215_13555 [Cohnella herbarum]